MVILAVLAGLAVVMAANRHGSPPPYTLAAGPAFPKPAPPPPPRPPTPTSWEVADAVVPRVALFQAPNVPAADGRQLRNPTVEGLPLVMLVHEDQGDWLHVQIPSRPNGSLAWVRRSDVTTRTVPNHILVNLAARRLSVMYGDQTIVTFPVAIGAPSGPTPTGSFFIDGVVRLTNTRGPYGAGQLSVAGFSNVYHSFGGGVGEIAIHGTNNPGLIGGTVSHGCVRMVNDNWLTVASMAPSGTPVDIVDA